MKYLLAYCVPLIAFLGVSFGGFWSYAGVVFAFGILPLLELIFPTNEKNYSEIEIESKLKNRFFDMLLYLNVFIVYGILFFVLHKVSLFPDTRAHTIGAVPNVQRRVTVFSDRAAALRTGRYFGHLRFSTLL